MTKRVTPHIVVLLFSFFIFLSQPLAETKTIPLQTGSFSDTFSLLEYSDTPINELVSDWLTSSNITDVNYVIYNKISNNSSISYFVVTIPSSYSPLDKLSLQVPTNNTYVWFMQPSGTLNTDVNVYQFFPSLSGSTANKLSWGSWPNLYAYPSNGWYYSDNIVLLYSTVPLTCGGYYCSLYDVSITYDNNSYSVPRNGNVLTFPTLYDLHELWYGEPPEPPDNYPLLTQFFTLFIDKITYVSEYFVSNYVYLYMFSLFIFFSFILLLKRRLF